ncbi:MAG: hypothetical protein ACI867_000218 [Glaciecola sp.]
MSARAFPTFTTPIRGHAFAGPAPDGAGICSDTPAAFVREPKNPRDPLAVAVWAMSPLTPWRVGYLERAVAARLAPRIDAGAVFAMEFDGWMPEPGGAWLRPAVRVSSATGVNDTVPQVQGGGEASASEDRLDGHQTAGRKKAFDDRVVEAA